VKARSEQAIILTAQEAAFVRQALVAASGIFAQAKATGGPGLRALQEAALDVPAGGRPLSHVHYDVCRAAVSRRWRLRRAAPARTAPGPPQRRRSSSSW
jgi:hypothetical protein